MPGPEPERYTWHLYIATSANFTPSRPKSSCVSGSYSAGLYAKAAGTILTSVPFMLAMCSSISLCQIKLEMWLKKSQVNKIKVHKSKKGFVQDPPPNLLCSHSQALDSQNTRPQGKGSFTKAMLGASPHNQDSGIIGFPASVAVASATSSQACGSYIL